MDRDEALRLLVLGLRATHACSRAEAPERAEALLEELLRDPPYVVEGEDVPIAFVEEALENL